MESTFFWQIPAAAIGLSIAAGVYGYFIRRSFERRHPKLTRAALKAESRMEAEITKKPGNVLPIRKVGGTGTAS